LSVSALFQPKGELNYKGAYIMKKEKIGQEIIKAYLKEVKIAVTECDTFVWITTNGFVGYYLHKKELPLNYDDFVKTDMFKRFSEKDYQEAYNTKEFKITDKKITAVKIKNESSSVWVDSKFLKNFENDATFKIKGNWDIVFVYENDVLRGLIMPLNIKE
jgi:hypothetical protein